MVKFYNPFIRPGYLEVFCGPMSSGKTRELVNLIDRFNHMSNYNFLLIKPKLDTRSGTIKTRFGDLEIDCEAVDENSPESILDLTKSNHCFVGIGEAQFFAKGIEDVVGKLISRDLYVVVEGLDLDFRGEPFGRMPYLMAIANEVHKLSAVCSISGCRIPATRTQRLIEGKPADYNSPLILIGDKKEGYEPRCIKHHKVPGKNSF